MDLPWLRGHMIVKVCSRSGKNAVEDSVSFIPAAKLADGGEDHIHGNSFDLYDE